MWQFVKNKLSKGKCSAAKVSQPTHPKQIHASAPNQSPAAKPARPIVENNIKHIIGIASGKGGVGKSTVCSNLAFALSDKGYKVGVLDADIYGPSQASLLGNSSKAKGEDGALLPIENHGIKFISMSSVNPKDGAVIVRAPVATRAVGQFLTDVRWGELDFLLVDLPPGTGDIPLTLAQKTSLAGVVIVTTPQPMATGIAAKSIEMFEKVNVPILGIIENMSVFTCPHCSQSSHIFNEGGGDKISKEYGVALLAHIPLNADLLSLGEQGRSLIEKDKAHPVSQAFLAAVDKLLAKV